MTRSLMFLAVLCCVLLTPCVALATEYHVGAGQPYATVNDLVAVVTLGDNDIVWVHPGTYPNFWVREGGGSSEAAAVQIRAWDPNDKPIFDAAGANNCAQFEDPESVYGLVGKWFLIENLEITGAASRGIYNVSCNIIVRHCYMHDNHNGYMGGWHNARDDERGDAIFEYNEFNRCGEGAFAHPMYMEGYLADVRYNWLHDSTGGNSYKDRSRDSVFEYNYISAGGTGYRAVQFCGFDDATVPSETDQYAMVIGNIITQNGGGNPWLFISNERTEGGKGDNTGYMTMVNNSCYSENHTGPMIAGDNIAVTTLHNNIFHSTTCDRMFDHVNGQQNYGIVNTSYNNWVRTGIALDPAMVDTVVGSSPGWVNGAWPLGDFHLASGSPCINAGDNSVPDLPTKEYSQPSDWVARSSDGQIDIGAHEYDGTPGPPVANFSGNPLMGSAPLTVYFTDLSSGAPTSWHWTFGDGGESYDQHPTHEYQADDSYTVSLTATNTYGQDTETKPDYITVSTGGGGDFFCTSAASEGGVIQSGTHTDLHASDDSYLVVDAVKLSGRYGTKMRYTFETELGSLSSLSITYENHPTTQPHTQQISVHNYSTGSDDEVDDRSITSTSDTTYEVTVSNPASYISATGQVQVYVRTGNLSKSGWTHYIDFLKITAAQ